MKKITILIIFCIGFFMSIQNFLPISAYRNIKGTNNDLVLNPNTSGLIIEDSNEFLEGTLENLTIYNNGYLMLESKFSNHPNWTNMAPTTKPSSRFQHSMAYDSNHDKTILFGGFNGSKDDETWAYDLETNMWTNMAPTIKPSARQSHSMAYDSNHDKIILFGGYDGSNDDETWTYDLETNTWTNMAPTTKPNSRFQHSMAYDSNHDKTILFGGYDGSNDNETWIYDLETNIWINMAPTTKPSARQSHSMAYDSIHDKTILFGGYDGSNYNETYAFRLCDYQQTGKFDSKIVGLNDICKFSGEISWSPENQTIGTNLTVQIGFSNTIHNEDFTYTSPENSSFIFEGVARYFKYRVNFESTNDLAFSPMLENMVIVYISEIESTQKIITIDESESEEKVIREDNPLAMVMIFCLIGVTSVLALIVILNRKKIKFLEKHIKLVATDLKPKKTDKMKNARK